MEQDEFNSRLDAGEDPYSIVADDRARSAATTEPRVLRALYKAEAAILSAYRWMPYPSDMEADEARREVFISIDAVDEGLREIRTLKDEYEKAILAAATSIGGIHE